MLALHSLLNIYVGPLSAAEEICDPLFIADCICWPFLCAAGYICRHRVCCELDKLALWILLDEYVGPTVSYWITCCPQYRSTAR